MLIQTIGPNDAAWVEALACTPHDIYHTAAYVATDAQRMQAKPEAVLVTDSGRQLFLPYLVRSCDQWASGVSDIISPYGYPGLLLNEAGRDAEFARAAWAALIGEWKAAGHCSAFLRMHPILSADLGELLPSAGLRETGLTVAADLSLAEDALWMGLGHNHRRSLQRCRKEGFTARFVPLAEYLDPYREVYNQTMDRVKAHDVYYFDEAYFRALSEQPGVHCCIVEKDKHLAAACLFFESHGIVQAHLGGSANEYYRQSPFHLCLYHAMLWAKSRGNRWLHLGGGVGGDDDALFKFKAGFSDARFSYQTARFVLNEERYRQLVEVAAAAQHTTAAELVNNNFFPAYRSRCLEKV